ncbi:hypothetical protein [Auritidibacter ignavus]|uniref:hypothetical protein n=1 Tax=Auritidibacter ignavus TaxID=678932 RepID=UPI0024BA60E9|nr:hypothetical protein [Auritidibacter ignavus]WHS27469.1 hypothetical protein QM395_08775 [Auritidibacter ignavus]
MQKNKLLIYGPLGVGALALFLLMALLLYLFIFGTLLGHNVSSLDGDGPQWPFATAWVLGWISVICVPLGALWAVIMPHIGREQG